MQEKEDEQKWASFPQKGFWNRWYCFEKKTLSTEAKKDNDK